LKRGDYMSKSSSRSSSSRSAKNVKELFRLRLDPHRELFVEEYESDGKWFVSSSILFCGSTVEKTIEYCCLKR
jgi:hypothetical protein